jgi:hypothetical protein
VDPRFGLDAVEKKENQPVVVSTEPSCLFGLKHRVASVSGEHMLAVTGITLRQSSYIQPFCFLVRRCNFSSILYPQSYWPIILVIQRL